MSLAQRGKGNGKRRCAMLATCQTTEVYMEVHQVISLFQSIDFAPLKDIFDLNDLRNILAILGAIFAISSALKKWGQKATASYSIEFSTMHPTYPRDITIINEKDKPLVIHRVIAIFDNNQYVTLSRLSPPMVIKGLESEVIEPERITTLNTDTNPFEAKKSKFDLALVTDTKLLKCKIKPSPDIRTLKYMANKKEITRTTLLFDGKVIPSNAICALTYTHENKRHVSFVLDYGLIVDGWPFPLNCLEQDQLTDLNMFHLAIKVLRDNCASDLDYTPLNDAKLFYSSEKS
ncbi:MULTISPECIES: hypothetical protein [Pseudomonadaceae]|uniref:hypothetical protein n=1 Tax=Pseudomonadaceae TaxID=135621 RepID=UPI001153C84E|nr:MULTISPECIES: hypothetical protein [Pseudomonas]MCP1616964.1 hypothetical protein [Pseudomonas otitidis]